MKLKQLHQAVFPIIAMTLLSACRAVEPIANASQTESIPVSLTKVENSTLQDSSEFVARLESRQSVELRPRVQGQVSQIFVKAGDTVKKGTPILQIDPREQFASGSSRASQIDSGLASAQRARASERQAQANVGRAIANLENARAALKTLEAERRKAAADVKFHRDQYDRYQKLHAEGAVSRQMLNQFRNNVDGAEATLAAAEAKIQAQNATIGTQQSEIAAQEAEVEVQRAEVLQTQQQIQQAQADTQEQQARLDYFTIRAPFDGIVGDIPVKIGDVVSPENKLAKFTQNEALEVNVSIPASRSQNVRPGTQIELLDNQGKRLATSRVSFISPNVSDTTQSLLIKARLDNTNQQLRADQLLRARVIWEKRPGLKVPTVAISRIAGQSFVFVAEQTDKGLVARQRPVKLGAIEGNDYQVIEGLNAGDQIVTSGLLQLSDGATISANPSKSPS